jgi:hypothetical protein
MKPGAWLGVTKYFYKVGHSVNHLFSGSSNYNFLVVSMTQEALCRLNVGQVVGAGDI